MREDNQGGRANEPKDCAKRRCKDEKWDTDHKETSIEVFLGNGVFANLNGLCGEAVDERKATDEEDECNQECSIGQNGIDGECTDDNQVIAAKVTSVIGDTRKGLVGIRWP